MVSRVKQPTGAMSRVQSPDVSEDTLYAFRTFGLDLHSTIDCPELMRVTLPFDTSLYENESDERRVRIVEQRLSDVQFEEIAENEWFVIRDGILYFQIEGVGRFKVANGDLVVFARDPSVAAPGVTDADVRVFLLGSCLGAIMQQRGLTLLHASTAVIDGNAVSFVGHSGAGKSTSLSTLMSDGHAMLSDDVTAIDFDHHGAHARPAYPQLKLNADSVELVGFDPASLPYINRFRSKHALSCPESIALQAMPLRAVFSLEPSPDALAVSIEPVHGAERFALLHRNTYRQAFHAGFGLKEKVARQVSELASQCDVYRIQRPMSGVHGARKLIDCVYQLLEV